MFLQTVFGEGFNGQDGKRSRINFKRKIHGDEIILDNGIHKRSVIVIMKYSCLKTRTLVL